MSEQAQTSPFMQLSPEEQYKAVRRRILHQGGTEQEHWLLGHLEDALDTLDACWSYFGGTSHHRDDCPDRLTCDECSIANDVNRVMRVLP